MDYPYAIWLSILAFPFFFFGLAFYYKRRFELMKSKTSLAVSIISIIIFIIVFLLMRRYLGIEW